MLVSGYFISKKKPHAKYLLFWNVIVGVIYMAGQFTNLYLTCPDGKMPLVAGKLINLTTVCNSGCICDSVPYSPVCHEDSGMTFFSPCHAGCHKWNEKDRFYSDCTCAPLSERLISGEELTTNAQKMSNAPFKSLPSFNNDYEYDYTKDETLPPSIVLSSTMETPTSFAISQSSTGKPSDDDSIYDDYAEDYDDKSNKRTRRDDEESLTVMLSGACMKGCAIGFYVFTFVSALINIFGASGRIGNLLVNYR